MSLRKFTQIALISAALSTPAFAGGLLGGVGGGGALGTPLGGFGGSGQFGHSTMLPPISNPATAPITSQPLATGNAGTQAGGSTSLAPVGGALSGANSKGQNALNGTANRGEGAAQNGVNNAFNKVGSVPAGGSLGGNGSLTGPGTSASGGGALSGGADSSGITGTAQGATNRASGKAMGAANKAGGRAEGAADKAVGTAAGAMNSTSASGNVSTSDTGSVP